MVTKMLHKSHKVPGGEEGRREREEDERRERERENVTRMDESFNRDITVPSFSSYRIKSFSPF